MATKKSEDRFREIMAKIEGVVREIEKGKAVHKRMTLMSKKKTYYITFEQGLEIQDI